SLACVPSLPGVGAREAAVGRAVVEGSHRYAIPLLDAADPHLDERARARGTGRRPHRRDRRHACDRDRPSLPRLRPTPAAARGGRAPPPEPASCPPPRAPPG